MPKGWEWTRLEDFVYAVTDGDHLPPPKSPSGVPFLVISDVNTGSISFDKARYAEKDYYNTLPEIRKAVKGDILFTVTGSYGIVIPVETEREFCFQRHIGLIKTLTSSPWLANVLQSDYVLSYCDKVATGTAQKTVSLAHLRDLLIPIPPQREQERINEELSKWLDAVNIISSNNERLSCAIDKTKSKILDLAIHGKLVPQDPNDEPAIELLKRINPKFTPCDNSHCPFDVPDKWIWAKGLDIFKPMEKSFPIGDTFKYIDIDAIDNKRNVITSVKVLDTEQAPSRASRYTEKGCVLFSMVRPYLRNIAMVTEDDCIASTGFFVCRGEDCLLPKFCYFQMLSNYVVDGLNAFMKGDNSPSITKVQIEEYIFPLPPINEQKRIVAKIEGLFAVLDEIQKSIEA